MVEACAAASALGTFHGSGHPCRRRGRRARASSRAAAGGKAYGRVAGEGESRRDAARGEGGAAAAGGEGGAVTASCEGGVEWLSPVGKEEEPPRTAMREIRMGGNEWEDKMQNAKKKCGAICI